VGLPHCPQRAVIIAYVLQAAASFACRLIHHERAQRKLQLRHIARELELATLTQRLRDRNMKHERPDYVLDNRNDPVTGDSIEH
jgi:hypothetical protein